MTELYAFVLWQLELEMFNLVTFHCIQTYVEIVETWDYHTYGQFGKSWPNPIKLYLTVCTTF